MTDDTSKGRHRGRGRPPGTTQRRWRVRAAIVEALAGAAIRGGRRATNAEIVALLDPDRKFNEAETASAKRAIRDERAELSKRHAPAHPTDGFVGLFDLPMKDPEDLEERERTVRAARDLKKGKAAARYARSKARRPTKK